MKRASAISFPRTIMMFAVFHLFLGGPGASAQDIEVGLTGGGCYYLGDLNPGKHFMNTQLAYGVLVRYNIDNRWSVKLSAMRGTVKGDAAQSTFLPDRQLTFSSYVMDISAVGEFNFFPYFTGSKRNWVTPYVYGGFGIFFFNPISADGSELKNLGTEGQNVGYNGRKPYSTVSFGFPFGIGVKMSLARKLGLQIYWELHKTVTDYLDDVSTTYPDYRNKYSDPTGTYSEGMQRGNAKNQDWYSFFGLSLTYKFKIVSNKRCRDLEN